MGNERQDRAERLAAALRDNLRRRKAQARAASATAPADTEPAGEQRRPPSVRRAPDAP